MNDCLCPTFTFLGKFPKVSSCFALGTTRENMEHSSLKLEKLTAGKRAIHYLGVLACCNFQENKLILALKESNQTTVSAYP
jgi:hypothetical protein